jgi:hypothetical protein
MKSKLIIFIEGMLYMIISAGPVWAVLMDSDKPLTERAITATSVASIVAAATALKAFLSQSMMQNPTRNSKNRLLNSHDRQRDLLLVDRQINI